jgi:cytosine/adenosine deaminase-related metal-dependent hydrolase
MVHATHAAEGFPRFVETGTGICVCRTTERFLADGHIAALPLEARLSFGSDSHAVIDLFEEARALELDERTRSGVRGTYSPETLLDAATAGGYGALGWEGGRLAPGGLADFIALDVSSVRTTAPHAPPAALAVFAASAADVTDVVVGGRRIVRDRRHHLIEDVPHELGLAIAAL